MNFKDNNNNSTVIVVIVNALVTSILASIAVFGGAVMLPLVWAIGIQY